MTLVSESAKLLQFVSNAIIMAEAKSSARPFDVLCQWNRKTQCAGMQLAN